MVEPLPQSTSKEMFCEIEAEPLKPVKKKKKKKKKKRIKVWHSLPPTTEPNLSHLLQLTAAAE